MIFILYLFLLIYLFSPDTNIFFSFFVPSFSLSIIIASLHISVFLCLNYVYIYAFEFFNHYLAYIRQGGGGDDYDDDNGDEMIAPLILIQRHCSTRLRCHSWVFIRFSRFSVPFSCFQFFSLCWKTRYPIWNSLSNQTKRTFFKIRFWKLRRVQKPVHQRSCDDREQFLRVFRLKENLLIVRGSILIDKCVFLFGCQSNSVT